MKTFDCKQTKWEGLWWHPEYAGFSSSSINLAKLKEFKGNVRLLVRKNKYYNNGENSRPNYLFCIKDSKSDIFRNIEVVMEPQSGTYQDNCGGRLYTEEEVRAIINGTVASVRYGVTDPYDILPSDFV